MTRQDWEAFMPLLDHFHPPLPDRCLWREPLAVGRPLPTQALAVRGFGCLPIDLEASYQEARQRGRIG